MKRFLLLAAVGGWVVGGLLLAGCNSGGQSSQDMHSTTSGGNGAFGESPQKPGQYSDQNHSGADRPADTATR